MTDPMTSTRPSDPVPMTDEARAGDPRPSTEAGRAFHQALTTDSQPGKVRRRPIAEWITDIEREAAAELWQQGYAAGLERGRQPNNHPSLDVERLRYALLDLAGLDYAYDARLDSGDYGLLDRPHEFADKIAAAYLRLSEKGDSL